jgi:beta-glucosidase
LQPKALHTVRPRSRLVAAIALALVLGAAQAATPKPDAPARDWPHVTSPIARDAAMEARIDRILAGMTLAQKVGQMTQAEIKSITPDEVRDYAIGSVLNGGGSWPGKNKHATPADWVALADAYYDASMATTLPEKIPVIWGVDAVHGHNNVYRATLFPHNIGLGAAHDPDLIRDIAAATASSVRATGLDWVFAPAVPVVQDVRWGRTYESWSSDPALVRRYAAAYVKGMQGTFDDHSTLVSVKHFMGDGGTTGGVDQGQTVATQRELVRTHAQGYFGGIGAGAQNIMVSYNSWKDAGTGTDHGKMHGNRLLLTDVLKDRIGFDGFLVSDWNAIGQVTGCTNASCPQSINAGVDMVMVPDDWKAFIANTVQQVESGEIPMSRIDDAVRRILRVKLRMGLFDGRPPSASPHAGDITALQHRDLARRAVRESLVLLKNNAGVLPIRRGARVLVVGRGANNLPMQAGGWSLTWQGDETSNADYPDAVSILAGLREVAGSDATIIDGTQAGAKPGDYDVAIAVIGESPYAETKGDVRLPAPLTHSQRYADDLALLESLVSRGKPVVTVFLSGRPVYANDLLNLSDAFVAAWLPGTEGNGIADVLLAGADGKPRHDFSGRLSFAWPGDPCLSRLPAAPKSATLFPLGYGLRYAQPKQVPASLPVSAVQSCSP